jgi:hypothetical protein
MEILGLAVSIRAGPLTESSLWQCCPCALSHYTKSKRCFICNQQTLGQFNTATKLLKKLEKYRAQKAAGGKDDKKQDDDEDDLSNWKEEERSAAQGWQIPGNTFADGKKF